MKSEITASWQRSQDFGVSRERQRAIVGSLDGLPLYDDNRWLQKNAGGHLRDLYNSVSGESFLICLTDPEGWVLSLVGDSAIRRRVEPLLLVPGANWAESVMGCSGIGVSLATAKPVQVAGGEHYLLACEHLACAAAPVTGPDGRMAGAVNITATRQDYNPFALGMVVAAADAIGESLRAPSLWAGADFSEHSGRMADVLSKPYTGNRAASSLPAGDNGEALRLAARSSGQVKPKTKPALMARHSFADIVGNGPVIQSAVSRARKAAGFSGNILILGGSGSGKGLFAQAIHNASARVSGNFCEISAATISDSMVASELFGYAGGAFTGARTTGAHGFIEIANGGTLFLDEIGEMPLKQQALLLRVMDEGRITRLGGRRSIAVDIRIIASSQHDLPALIEQKRFRSDLYHRLAGLTLRLPALADCPEDIPCLAKYFLNALAPGRELAFSDKAMQILETHTWPGNVRELRNVINQAIFECEGQVIEPQHIIFTSSPGQVGGRHRTLKEIEDEAIRRTLEACHGDMTETARILGVSLSTLYRRRRD
ncbi:MAG: sigma 54-interacting transcriptional regulator [Coriobacteriales bacterium]|jgi:transcriptional regulator of acetoin/glycerol metabolism|nr:sigma 54-interacting transcriptional regulator [Coriobacteriales bacterium]